MTVEFHWEVESEEWKAPQPPERWRRFPWRVLGALALLLAVVAGIAAGRFWRQVQQGEARLERELRSVVNLEAQALRDGDWDLFLSLQDRDDTEWYGLQQRKTEAMASWPGLTALEPGQQVDLAVLDAALIPSDSRAWVEVAWAMEDGIYRRVQFYRQEDGRWLRTGSRREYYGGTRIRETTHFAFKYQARDEPTVDWMAGQLEAWYKAACADLGCDSAWRFDVLVTTRDYRPPRGFVGNYSVGVTPTPNDLLSPSRGFEVNSPRLYGVREDGAPLPEERASLAQVLLHFLVSRQAGDVEAGQQPYLLPQFVNWEMRRLGLADEDTPATPLLDYVMATHGIGDVRALLRDIGQATLEGEALRLAVGVGLADMGEAFDQYLAALLAVERQMMEFQTTRLVGPTAQSLAQETFDALLARTGWSWQSDKKSAFQRWGNYPGGAYSFYGSAVPLSRPTVDRWAYLDASTVWAEVVYSEASPNSSARDAVMRVEFFRQVDGSWRHDPPDERFLGEKAVLESEHFRIEGHERQMDMMAGGLVYLESLYRQMADALQTDFPPGERMVIKILSSTTSPGFDAEAVSLPVPYLEAWSYDLGRDHLATYVSWPLFRKLALLALGWSEKAPSYSELWGYIVFEAWQSQVLGPGFQYDWEHQFREVYPWAAASRSGELLTLTELGQILFESSSAVHWPTDRWNLAYQEARVVLGYMTQTWGVQVFPKLLRALPEADSMDSWLRLALGVDLETFEAGWQAWLREQAAP
jgi:hypothetical protein